MNHSMTAYWGSDPYLFVCYAHADSDELLTEMTWINDNACPVWYDEGIHPGATWREEVAERILGSSLFLIFLSPFTVRSEECLKELNFALDHGKAILAVFLEPFDLPPGLKLALLNRQAIEKYRYDPEIYQARLLNGVEELLGTSDAETRQERFAAGRSSANAAGFESRYELYDKVDYGFSGTLYRALDRVRQSHVVVKRGAAFGSDELDLAGEFRVLATLRHPNIVVAVDYGFEDNGREFLVLELPEATARLAAVAKSQPTSMHFDYLSQGLRAINYLHHKGLLHRGLGPDSVVVVDGRLKLLDFAFCGEAGRLVAVPAGTYLAPEVSAGRQATPASDLYSFGHVAFSAFFGSPPEFAADADRNTIASKLALDGLDERLARVFGGLLVSDKALRFQSAAEAFAAIDENESGEAIETALTRESALQTAQFVGRKAELAMLRRALEAAKRGHGRTVLISGESGIGKSRLVNELETTALIEGFRSMRGHTVEGDTGSFRVWNEVARHYGILVQNEATPELGDSSPGIDKDSFLKLEAAMRRHRNPVLIVLEDLHWAGTESLRLLSWLATPVRTLPVLIVGTLRGDEASDLKDSIDGVQDIQLSRLSQIEVKELASNIVGTQLNERMQEFLIRESEGNSFFIVETLRVLAEHTGFLGGVGSQALPERVFSSGMRQIFRRRLARLSAEDQEALRIAAVVGRSVDPDLMTVLLPDLEFVPWASRCAKEAVFEYQESAYRFTHEKLRNHLLESAGEARSHIHRSVAQAMESAAGSHQGLATSLAYHWRVAGDRNKEAYYAYAAAEQTLEGGATLEAVGYLKRVRELLAAGAELPVMDISAAAAVEAKLGEAYYQLGNLAECKAHSERALRLLGASVPSSSVGMGIGAVTELLKSLRKGAYRGRSATAVEISRAQLHLTDIYFYALRALPAAWSTLRAVNEARTRGDKAELAQGYALLSVLFASMKGVSRGYQLKALQASRAANDIRNRSFVYCRFSTKGFTYCSWPELRRRLPRGLKLAELCGDLRLLLENMMLSGLVDLYVGDFKKGLDRFIEVQDFSRRTDNRQIECWGAQHRAVSLIRLGRAEEARALTAPMLEVANDPYMKTELFTTQSILALINQRAGETARAVGHIEEAIRCLASMPPIAYWVHIAFACLLEAIFAISSNGSIDNKAIQSALAGLKTFARIQNLGEPLLALWAGKALAAGGNTRRALKRFEQGLQRAEALGMAYEKACLQLEIARLGVGESVDLESVVAEFTRMGCAHELNAVHQLIDEGIR